MTPQFHRFAKEKNCLETKFTSPYIRQHADGHPRSTNRSISPIATRSIYYPPSPRAMIEVVDPDNPTQMVDYGKTGNAMRLTTLTKEFFMPIPGARRVRA